jgi:hypothetical protein
MNKDKMVKIELDKERYLYYDMNALCDLEEAGVDFENMQAGKAKLSDLRLILWSGLRHEDESLTPRQVGAMISISDMERVSKAIEQAFKTINEKK